MVKTLRKKFVIVTMTLMIAVFGILFLADYFYNEYWSDLDTLQILEWLSDSGVLLDGQKETQELLNSEKDYEDNPIYGIQTDNNGNVIAVHKIGNGNTSIVSNETIQKILRSDTDKYKVGSYIYSRREINNDNTLIVIVDSKYHDGEYYRFLAGIILVIAGIALLSAISFYLSKFVTTPAEDAIRREKQFVSDASHELKTPLGAISINAQALAVEYGENKHTKNILSETERMDRLIIKLLTLSRIEGGKNDSGMEDFSLSSCVEEMALTYESVAFEKGIECQIEVQQEICYSGNEDEVKQLLAILIDNAIKNTNKKGQIRLKVFKKNSQIIIQVMNTGNGIAPEHIPHIFERFYSTDSSRSSDSFGIGLAIAKAIVERHKGKITVQSEYGKNTCFTVRL